MLHLAFRPAPGDQQQPVMVDMDLVPFFQCSNNMEYDGDINDYAEYLLITRPRGWLQELHKLESMTAVGDPSAVRCSRVKLVNKNTVIPSQVIRDIMIKVGIHFYWTQVLLFLRSETLEGSKNQVYVLLKLQKKLTAAKVTR